jgi:hypothetical protein
MINLAGTPNPDPFVERELVRCRIAVVRGETGKGEVATAITGRLGPFAFRRAWRYWVVDGPLPLAVAEELYADPVGREDVRADGNCTRPPPRDEAEWYDGRGRKLIPKTEEAEFRRIAENSGYFRELLGKVRFVDDPTRFGRGFVETYHIDSEVGLRLFADAIRRHGIDGEGGHP